MAGNLNFTRNGATGKVENEGSLTAELGGYIALLAPEVRNNGIVIAQGGTVALAAGEAFELQFDGARLTNIRVEPATIAALVENGNAVQAPGGLIILSAQAANRLQGGVVNNTGSLEATGLVDNGGTIRLEASDRISHTGSINVDAASGKVGAGGTALLITDLTNHEGEAEINGNISARGGDLGGDGGFVETSAGRVNIGTNTQVNTLAPKGQAGTWLIDPTNFTISASADAQNSSGVGNQTLQTNLEGGNVIIATASAGSEVGDIYVNAPISWSANTLSLQAHGDININDVMTASDSAILSMRTGYSTPGADGGTYLTTKSVKMGFNADGTFKGRVDLPGRSGTGILFINDADYTVINSLGVAADGTSGSNQTLQGMARTANLGGNFALGSNIDASATSGWNSTQGFLPIGNSSNRFSGKFDGLGHTISGLYIKRTSTQEVGLFGRVDAAASPAAQSLAQVRNVGLTSGYVEGWNKVGGLVGRLGGYGVGTSSVVDAWVANSYFEGTVKGTDNIGGLIGYARRNAGGLVWVTDNRTNITVTASGNSAGGLAAYGQSVTYLRNYAAGSVTGVNTLGGLVGGNTSSTTITDSYAAVSLTNTGAGLNAGGLVPSSGATITNSYYPVESVTINGVQAPTIGALYATQYTDWQNGGRAALNIANYTGDGKSFASCGTNCYQISTIQGLKDVLGFSTLSAATFKLGATIDVASTPGFMIPFFSAASFDGNSHSVLNLSINQAKNRNLGLIGELGGSASVLNVGTTGSVSGASYAGGLIGRTTSGTTHTISNVYSNATVSTTGTVNAPAGGLIGWMSNGTVSNAYATGNVTSGQYGGGLIGNGAFQTLTNVYATGSVSGTAGKIGGLVGKQSNGTLTNSYWNSDTIAAGIGNGSFTTGSPSGLSSNDTKVQASYNTWNFSTNWLIYENQTTPLLRSFLRPLTVTASNATKTYDGLAYSGGNGVAYSATPDGNLLGSVSYSGTSQGAINAASYIITPSGFYSNQQGYAIAYADGNLIINAAPPPATGTTGTTETFVPPPPPPPTPVIPGPTTTTLLTQPDTPLTPTGGPVPTPGGPITGSADTGGNSDGQGAATGPHSAGVSVSLVQEPSVQQTGIITVSVPKEMATAGSGFSFPLPAQVSEAAGSNTPIQVTTTAGDPLPGWLSFNPETKAFVASAVPDGAFPMQVIVTIGGTRTTIVISERTE
ncbi:MAG: hypothetical protein Q8M20_02050 [Rhodocyclaceae bacterium]|nr:hypothetical protein [Rhodocyclaceae bacterium]